MGRIFALLFILPVVISGNNYLDYKGYKFIKVHHQSHERAQAFKVDFTRSSTDLGNLQFEWSMKHSDIIVSPEQLLALESILKDMGVDYEIAHQDVSKMISDGGFFTHRRVAPLSKRGQMSSLHKIELDRWNSHENINTWLKNLQTEFYFVSLAGFYTYEKREQIIMTIEKAGKDAPYVLLSCGIHAREWLSPSSCLYVIDQLLFQEDGKQFLNNVNFHIVPSMNPDGYEYSNSTYRMWRKNRNPDNNPDCVGIDLNRNYGYHWGLTGASDDPCSDIYYGPEEFSEVESQNIKHYLESLPIKPTLALSIHCCVGWILLPYGYDYNKYPENRKEIDDLGHAAASAMSKVGRTYEAHGSADLYPASGTSTDWYVGGLGVRFGYTIELQGTFVDKERNIIPTAKEVWAGFKTMLSKVIEVSK